MTPLQAMGEALKALRIRISGIENRAGEFEKAVTGGFMTQKEYIEELFASVDRLESENRDLCEKIKHQDATIIEILDVVAAIKSA